jgi:hypothetical protein
MGWRPPNLAELEVTRLSGYYCLEKARLKAEAEL